MGASPALGSNDRGQALLEFLASILTVVLTIATSGWLLKIEWDRGRCAYIVFENTHAQVADSPPPQTPPWFSSRVKIHDLPDSVEGSSQCGDAQESVSLPKLDPSAPDSSAPDPSAPDSALPDPSAVVGI